MSDEIRYYLNPFVIKLFVFLYDFILLLLGTALLIHNCIFFILYLLDRNVTQGEFSKMNLIIIPVV